MTARYAVTFRDGTRLESPSIEALLPDEDLDAIIGIEDVLRVGGVYRTLGYTLQRIR